MLIWHVNPEAVPESVNGVSTTIWTVAKAQADAGHAVTLMLFDPPPPATIRSAQDAKLTLLFMPSNALRVDPGALQRALRSRPQVVHMHSVFEPRQVGVARALVRLGIPYVVTPHGGISPRILERGRLKKALYGLLCEKPRFRAAAAVTAVMPGEVDEIDAYMGGEAAEIPVVPNPIDSAALGTETWRGNVGPVPRLVYLGRMDVRHKGIDRLVEIARSLPDVKFDLHVPQRGSPAAVLAGLKAPPNVNLRPPIYGPAKAAALTGATAYLQTSRWEAFGVSVAEAMFLGLPCAVMNSMNIAELIAATGAGLVLSQNPAEAARALGRWLRCPEALKASGRRAREVAVALFSAAAVADAYLRLYAEVIDRTDGVRDGAA